MKRVTISDVAKHSGASKMTVSRVIQKNRCVKEKTRERVQASIDALGYKPDPMLRSLAVYRSRLKPKSQESQGVSIAYLDCSPDAYSKFMYETALEEAMRLGYDLKYYDFPYEVEMQRKLSRRLWALGTRGLLFGPSKEERSIGGMQLDRFSLVSMGAFHHLPPIDAVSPDYFQILDLAATQCYSQGARRIALLVPDYLQTRTAHRWLGAYLAFCKHYRITPRHWDGETSLRYPLGVEEWIKRNKIDALLGVQGIRIYEPQFPNVIFAALNDWQQIGYGGHVKSPYHLIAREAVRILDYSFLHQRYGVPEWPRHVLIEGKWQSL